jgi:hypothetical protein
MVARIHEGAVPQMTRNLRDGGRTATSLAELARAQRYLGLGYSAERVAEITGLTPFLVRYLKDKGAWTAPRSAREEAAA